ncbi:MAG: hypothetical protein J6Z80_00065 [Clostridia bacterium]|nr:hypothetical protein [Clostridia bacterium]
MVSLSTDGYYMYRVAARKADTPEGIWHITAGIGRFYSAWDDRSWYTF